MGKYTAEEESRILQLAARRLGARAFFSSLEDLVTSEHGFGLKTATPLQRVICRIIQGEPLGDLATHPDVVEALGGVSNYSATRPPREVLIVAGIRGAKSLIAAATAIWSSQTCGVAGLLAGEIPRYSVLSLSKDNAKVVLQHLQGALQQPRLRMLHVDPEEAKKWKELIDDPEYNVVGSEFLWHPSGRPVEIRVVAGKRAGGSLVSRWSAGAALDEAPRMVGASEGVVNYEDARNAVFGRLLPGATLLSIGSPWQPHGPVYDAVQEHWGRPGPDRVVIKARGPLMNPYWWTPERCAEVKATNKVAYQTDVQAEFADAEESLYPQELLAKCTRAAPAILRFTPRHDYVCAMDPATRNNAWTMVICDRWHKQKRVCLAKQWKGSSQEPLSPRAVLVEARVILAEYRLDWFYTDQWAAEAIKDIAHGLGLSAIVEDWNEHNKIDAFSSLAAAMADGGIELPPDPILLKDLRLTKKVPTNKGVSIRLTYTSDGRHCDYAPALARAMFRWIEDEKAAVPRPGDAEFDKYREDQFELAEEKRFNKKNDDEWWDFDPWSAQ